MDGSMSRASGHIEGQLRGLLLYFNQTRQSGGILIADPVLSFQRAGVLIDSNQQAARSLSDISFLTEYLTIPATPEPSSKNKGQCTMHIGPYMKAGADQLPEVI